MATYDAGRFSTRAAGVRGSADSGGGAHAPGHPGTASGFSSEPERVTVVPVRRDRSVLPGLTATKWAIEQLQLTMVSLHSTCRPQKGRNADVEPR
jgi:hypothetical protein